MQKKALALVGNPLQECHPLLRRKFCAQMCYGGGCYVADLVTSSVWTSCVFERGRTLAESHLKKKKAQQGWWQVGATQQASSRCRWVPRLISCLGIWDGAESPKLSPQTLLKFVNTHTNAHTNP